MASLSVPRSFLELTPQLLTGSRLASGVAALLLTLMGQSAIGATLVIIFVITDGLDGAVARRFDATSEFGALFDSFVGDVSSVVVPVAISVAMFRGEVGVIALAIFGIPAVAGAIRYARNLLLARQDSFYDTGLPGLGTMFYGFFVFAVCFLDREGSVNRRTLVQLLVIFIPVSTLLMLSNIRYPKLAKYLFVLVPVIVGLNIMPYYATSALAITTLVVILVYVILSPLLLPQPWLHKAWHNLVSAGTTEKPRTNRF